VFVRESSADSRRHAWNELTANDVNYPRLISDFRLELVLLQVSKFAIVLGQTY